MFRLAGGEQSKDSCSPPSGVVDVVTEVEIASVGPLNLVTIT
jgi:hypothetical protein